VAHTKCQRQQGQGKHEQPSHSTQGRNWQTVESEYGGSSNFWSTEPDLGRVANGVPNRVHRLKGLGNAQVPLQAAAAYRLLGGI
jgi:DNA (cytosine-5)-methyltransferase 1